jgi:hypothetical protein
LKKRSNQHAILFSDLSLEIEKICWCIQKADNEIEKRCFIRQEKSGFAEIIGDVLTPFGKEVGSDEIHWWVFKKEPKIQEMLEKTNNVLIPSPW